MEKSSCMAATQKAYSTKDGIHLLFPFIVAEKETYKTLRENLLTIDMEELFTENHTRIIYLLSKKKDNG